MKIANIFGDIAMDSIAAEHKSDIRRAWVIAALHHRRFFFAFDQARVNRRFDLTIFRPRCYRRFSLAERPLQYKISDIAPKRRFAMKLIYRLNNESHNNRFVAIDCWPDECDVRYFVLQRAFNETESPLTPRPINIVKSNRRLTLAWSKPKKNRRWWSAAMT